MNPLLVGTLGFGMGALVNGLQPTTPKPPAHASVGFTAPTDIYEVMRQIQTSAEALNPDVATNVMDPAFRQAWAAWFREWRAFFDANYRTFKTLLHTDELKAQVETYRLQLLSWYEGYARQTGPAGRPVPPPHGVPPFRPPPSESGGESGGSILPWWAWVLGGVALVGAGYLAYRKYHELHAKRRALETEVLPGLIGAPLAKAAAARDPEPLPGMPAHVAYGRDPRSVGDARRDYVLTDRDRDSRDYILTNFDRDRDRATTPAYDRDAHLPAWYLEGRR